MSWKRIEIAVILILIIGLIGYAGAGLVYSGSRVTNAEHTLNTVVSHQNALNATFNDLNSQLSALNGTSAFNSQQALALVDKSVANSELATQTINQDDASLSTAARDLGHNPWLTLVGRSSLNRESTRIAHARKALDAARTVSADEVLDGHFWHALYTGLADLANLNSQSGAGDLNGAKTTLSTMKSDVEQAAQLSTSPGLPPALHDLMVDFQSFVTDYGKQLDAQLAGDDSAVATYQASVQADLTRIGTYNIDQIGTQIDAFYKPLIDRFNSEIVAATT
ncbi:MAG: hypothetical protein E6J20_13790 [Chloroflexi bacterium]|nr:MAG: hypothetical protein E6J20_13790 [Chloroflexota bacterium]